MITSVDARFDKIGKDFMTLCYMGVSHLEPSGITCGAIQHHMEPPGAPEASRSNLEA